MRKVLSFVLVLALVLGSFSMAFAATPAKGFSDTDAEAVSVLADLGVINGYADGTFKPANVVTRAEMAKLIIVALGLEDFATATTSKYTDMAGAGWAQGYVAYATSLGIIVGYPDGTFGPSNPVTYNEACAMIVRALGYTADFLPGEWPAEWVVKAQTLGILDGVTAAGAAGATRGNIAEMLYNALELEIGYVNKDGDWVANAPQDTMLIRLGATFIAADDTKALTGAGFEADGIIYGDEDSTINLRPFVGAYADRYVNDDNEIIKVVPVSEFLTGDYDVKNGEFDADNDVDYNISDALATAKAITFANGEEVTKSTVTDTATDMTIAVDLSGKTIKEVYSIATWTANDWFQFDKDYADEIADDQELDTHKFILDDNDEIDMNSFDLLGVNSLDAIEEDNVVYVYVNNTTSDQIRKIEVGTEVVEGKVTKISGDDYTIAGKVYNLSDVTDPTNLEVGDSGTAYLDYNGDVAYWDIDDAASGNYAVLVAKDTSTSFETTTVSVKLFTEEGEEITPVVKDAVSTTALSIANDTIVEYSLNSAGKVDSITKAAVASTLSGKTSKDGSLIGTTPVKDGVVVFLQDSDGDYTIGDVNDFDSDINTAGITPNKCVLDSGKIAAILISDEIIGAESTFGVINTTSKAINADDDVVLYLDGFINGKVLSAFTDTTDYAAYTITAKTAPLQVIDVDADGVVTDVKDVAAADVYTSYTAVATVSSIDGSLIKIDGAYYKVADNAVMYVWSTDDSEWVIKTSISSLKGKTVKMYQTDEDVVGFDIIMAY